LKMSGQVLREATKWPPGDLHERNVEGHKSIAVSDAAVAAL
jgi:hypothetical protein